MGKFIYFENDAALAWRALDEVNQRLFAYRKSVAAQEILELEITINQLQALILKDLDATHKQLSKEEIDIENEFTFDELEAKKHTLVAAIDNKCDPKIIIQLKEEYDYFQVIFQKSQSPAQTVHQAEVEYISDKMELIETAVDIHETFEDIHEASVANLGPLDRALSFLGFFASYIPPLRAALTGIVGIWDLYTTIDENHPSGYEMPKRAIAVASIGLGIAIVSCPPLAFGLGFAAMGVGLIREGIAFLEIDRELDKEREKLAEYQQKLAVINALPATEQHAEAKTFFEHAIKMQTTRVKQLEYAREQKADFLKISLPSVIGTILLFIPPTSLAGAIILLCTVAIKVGQKTGFFDWLSKKASEFKKALFDPPKPAVKDEQQNNNKLKLEKSKTQSHAQKPFDKDVASIQSKLASKAQVESEKTVTENVTITQSKQVKPHQVLSQGTFRPAENPTPLASMPPEPESTENRFKVVPQLVRGIR